VHAGKIPSLSGEGWGFFLDPSPLPAGRQVGQYHFMPTGWVEEVSMKRYIFSIIFSILFISIPLLLMAQERKLP
jgi:hypothetical protein